MLRGRVALQTGRRCDRNGAVGCMVGASTCWRPPGATVASWLRWPSLTVGAMLSALPLRCDRATEGELVWAKTFALAKEETELSTGRGCNVNVPHPTFDLPHLFFHVQSD